MRENGAGMRNQLQCDMPNVTVTKPKGLSRSMFFKAYSGPNAIAIAQLSSRAGKQLQRSARPQIIDGEKAPGVSYCLRIIEVSQNYRNKGIGSALLNEIIEFCRDEQVSSIYGEAKGEIAALRRWYQSQGFELDNADNIQLSL